MGSEIKTSIVGRRHNRDLFVDGQPVSHLVVHDLWMWLRGVRVRMGGIGGVSTPPAHRMKGYSRMLLEDTVRYMTGQGWDVSMLFGIPGFYGKFGFVTALARSTTQVATRGAEAVGAAAPTALWRPVEPEDYPFILELYARWAQGRSGPVVREPESFRDFTWGTYERGTAHAFLLATPSGERLGYAALADRSDEVTALEVATVDRGGYLPMLRELARLAVERRCGEITLHAPPDDPFASFLHRCGCRVETIHLREAGGMMRILNQGSLFSRLEAALDRRIAESSLAAPGLRLRLRTELGETELRLGGDGSVAADVSLPQATLMQLLMGYREAADALEEPDVRCDGEARRALEILFTSPAPYVWQKDRF